MTDKPFSVDGVEAPKEFTVRPIHATKSEIRLQVTFRPENPPGWRDGKIKLRLSGTRLREVALPFKAMVEGVLDTDPNFLNFGSVIPGRVKVLTFRVVNRSGKPVKLRLASHPPFVETVPVNPDATSWQAKLKVPYSASPSQVLSGKIVFKTNLPLQPLLGVPFFAAAEGSKALSATKQGEEKGSEAHAKRR